MLKCPGRCLVEENIPASLGIKAECERRILFFEASEPGFRGGRRIWLEGGGKNATSLEKKSNKSSEPQVLYTSTTI